MAEAIPDDVFADDITVPAVDGYKLAATLFLARGARRRHAVLINSATAVPRVITGRNLAHTKRTAVERALLAADIAAGRVAVKPTLKQAIAPTGASPRKAKLLPKVSLT